MRARWRFIATGIFSSEYKRSRSLIYNQHPFRLIDPYNAPVLRVRRPGSDIEEVLTFEGDDPFLSEVHSGSPLYPCLMHTRQLSTLVDVIEHGPQAGNILSSFKGWSNSYIRQI